jgi:regulator of cell morphogenesis and NO signaling
MVPEQTAIQESLKDFRDTGVIDVSLLENESISDIVDFLQEQHTKFLRSDLPFIGNQIHNLVQNADPAPLIEYLENFFANAEVQLLEHLKLEEQFLFPYLKQLEALTTGSLTSIEDRLSDFSINKFELEHDHTIENGITNVRHYIVDHCSSAKELLPYGVIINKLQSFEKELRMHAAIEDELLIPKGRVCELAVGR